MPGPLLPIRVSHEHPGSEITGDVFEFGRAMEVYQRRYRRRYPAWSEVLYVLRTLGYAKRTPGAAYPPLPEGRGVGGEGVAESDRPNEMIPDSSPRSGGCR